MIERNDNQPEDGAPTDNRLDEWRRIWDRRSNPSFDHDAEPSGRDRSDTPRLDERQEVSE